MAVKNILYAPGMGQDYRILQEFRNELETMGYTFSYIDFLYDEGSFNPKSYDCIINNTSEWWIGISLGASVLYYMYNFAKNKPERITIINPFSDRRVLANEKGFDISTQWDFSPKSIDISVKHIDLVTSVYDQSISMYHGIELINKADADTKNIIYVDADHQINSIKAQIELAQCLYNKKYVRGTRDGYKSCNIYQWERDLF